MPFQATEYLLRPTPGPVANNQAMSEDEDVNEAVRTSVYFWSCHVAVIYF